ncbi:MAG TPA: hypothetical protein V6C81_31720 [Planktothrix sp.]|jgi:hypothetical protein
MQSATNNLISKDLRHLTQLVIDHKQEFEKLKKKILEADGYIFWAERGFRQILDPFHKLGAEPPTHVRITQEEADALDAVGPSLRVFITTLAAYEVFLKSVKDCKTMFDQCSELLEAHPGGIMPGKRAPAVHTDLLPLIEDFSKILDRVAVERKVMEVSLELCGEGRINEGLEHAKSAFQLAGVIKSFNKGRGFELITLIPSATKQ